MEDLKNPKVPEGMTADPVMNQLEVGAVRMSSQNSLSEMKTLLSQMLEDKNISDYLMKFKTEKKLGGDYY